MDGPSPGWSTPTMASWIERLSDEGFRTTLGGRFEAATGEVFNVLRWSFVVGFARFLTLTAPSIWFDAIYWTTSVMLFGYLASRFLLRPEVRIFGATDRRWKRVVQSAVNYVLCLIAFVLVMWTLNHLVEGMARHRFAPVAA